MAPLSPQKSQSLQIPVRLTPFSWQDRNERIEERDITTEASESYLSYAMSVILGRALPDVRDGLKPVHRRILYGMYELRMSADKPFKKCARVVGEVLGKYHPHGDAAVYAALVRMAQDFSMRYTLINGHGNFGSLDHDPPAAMRYTECKLRGVTDAMLLEHLEEDTVDFVETFDASQKEPAVFPAKIPNLLINGSHGVAVGMATSVPPHNMKEVVLALKALIQDPEISVTELMRHLPAPDFPTGGVILRTAELEEVYKTGRGSVSVRGKVRIEGEKSRASRRTRKLDREALVVTELPYMTNKALFVERIAKLVEVQTLEGIADILDESDRDGMRIVIELKKGALGSVVLNNLYKHTELQTRFHCNLVAVVEGRPQLLNLKQMLSHFLNFRVEVVKRRAQFQLEKATQRLAIVAGLLRAMENVESVIALMKKSEAVAEARRELAEMMELTEEQAAAVAAMPLSRLSKGEVHKLEQEHSQLTDNVSQLQSLLSSPARILKEIQKEANQIEHKFGDGRRTELVDDEGALTDMDFIPNDPMIITFSKKGYLKRMLPEAFSVQRRGGRGVHGAKMRGDDTMNEILHVNAHDQVLFFSKDGRVFVLRAYQVPQSSRTAAGTPISHILPAFKETQLTSIYTLGSNVNTGGRYLVLGTKKGLVKKTPLHLFQNIRSIGVVACRLKEDDELRFVETASDECSLLMATDKGRVLRFNVDKLRPLSRSARGVQGINVMEGEVVGLAVLPEGEEVSTGGAGEEQEITCHITTKDPPLSEISCLLLTAKGIGKLVQSRDFPVHNRRGRGPIGIRLKQDDALVNLSVVAPDYGPQELLVASEQGMMTRIRVDSIRQLGRYTQGVKVMRLKPDDFVTSVTSVVEEGVDG